MKSPGERGKEARDRKSRAAGFFHDAKPYARAYMHARKGRFAKLINLPTYLPNCCMSFFLHLPKKKMTN